jgi:hypothetical protein
MSKIVATLQVIEERRARLADLKAKAQAFIPADLQADIDTLAAEVKALESDVKTQADNTPNGSRRMFASDGLQLVFKPHGKGGRWVDAKLEALVDAYEIPRAKLEACRTPWVSTWTLRKR